MSLLLFLSFKNESFVVLLANLIFIRSAGYSIFYLSLSLLLCDFCIIQFSRYSLKIHWILKTKQHNDFKALSFYFFVFVLFSYNRNVSCPTYEFLMLTLFASHRFSIERRWSSRTFRYGYLVTTSPQSSVLPSTASSLRLDYRLRVPPTLMVWRAVCTRPGNVFTAACWSAITSNSTFI